MTQNEWQDEVLRHALSGLRQAELRVGSTGLQRLSWLLEVFIQLSPERAAELPLVGEIQLAFEVSAFAGWSSAWDFRGQSSWRRLPTKSETESKNCSETHNGPLSCPNTLASNSRSSLGQNAAEVTPSWSGISHIAGVTISERCFFWLSSMFLKPRGCESEGAGKRTAVVCSPDTVVPSIAARVAHRRNETLASETVLTKLIAESAGISITRIKLPERGAAASRARSKPGRSDRHDRRSSRRRRNNARSSSERTRVPREQ